MRMMPTNILDKQSPFGELERNRRKRLVSALIGPVMISSVIVTIVYCVMWIIRPSWQSTLSVLVGILTIIMCRIVERLGRRGRVEIASYILLFSLLLAAGLVGLVIDGLSPVIPVTYAAMIVIAGLLLGSSGAFITAVVAVVLWVVTLIIERQGVLLVTVLPESLSTIILVVVTGVCLIFCALMSHLATEDLRGALSDATYELIQANRNLDKANRMKSQFLACTSHELRTPLNAIVGYTDLTLRRVYGSLTEMQEDGLKRVLSNAKRLQALINDILDLSKIEAGEMELAANPLGIQSLVDAVEHGVGDTARRKELQFSITVDPAMPQQIIGDEIRLAQILVNLSANAVKFTLEGRVSILIEPLGSDRWHMQVRDTGIGIREEDFERIFDEFRQIRGTFDERIGTRGSGLGLAITRQLILQMGGEISVDSKLGAGSVFDVILPLKAELAQTKL